MVDKLSRKVKAIYETNDGFSEALFLGCYHDNTDEVKEKHIKTMLSFISGE